MELTLDDIKVYLKIDGSEEDNLLLNLKIAAETYLEEAGIKNNYIKHTYRLCILMLLSHYYINRGVVSENTKYSMVDIPFGVRAIIQQLQLGDGATGETT